MRGSDKGIRWKSSCAAPPHGLNWDAGPPCAPYSVREVNPDLLVPAACHLDREISPRLWGQKERDAHGRGATFVGAREFEVGVIRDRS